MAQEPVEGLAEPLRVQARGIGGAARHEVAHAVLQQESPGPVCSLSEAKDPFLQYGWL